MGQIAGIDILVNDPKGFTLTVAVLTYGEYAYVVDSVADEQQAE